MEDQSNRFSKFWNELKRRKVVKVIVIYATTTFILLQLISILIEPLHLPQWVMTFFIVFLIVGFPIAVIFSWIFDVTPDGLKVTQPVSGNDDKAQTVTVSKKKTYITNGFIGVLLIVVAVLVYPKIFKSGNQSNVNPELEKSIAVLPFIDDSPEEGNAYIINGLMEEILNKLEKIQELNVKSRTAVEKYRGSKTDFSDIAKELNVNYILEGSGQKVGGRIKLMLQLIDAGSGNHLWSSPYIKEVNDENIFELQENVALSVANELKAIITPEEKEQLIKMPTENLAAYNLYLRGLEHLSIYQKGGGRDQLYKSKKLIEQAISIDTTFANAYSRLAHIYISTLSSTPDLDLSELYLDSGLIMLNKALFYDKQALWASGIKRNYYLNKGMFKEATELFEKNNTSKIRNQSYYETAVVFYSKIGNIYKATESFYKFLEVKPEKKSTPLYMLTAHSVRLAYMGYLEIGEKYFEEYLIQTNDSSLYFYALAEGEMLAGNFITSLDYALKASEFNFNPFFNPFYTLANNYNYLRDYSTAYKYLQLIENRSANSGNETPVEVVIGHVYLQNGLRKEADYQFEVSEKDLLKRIELNRPEAQRFESQLWLASIYSMRGEKAKAMEYLRLLKKLETTPIWMVTYLKLSPMLDNIMGEPEFAEILADVEAKYQKEHERVGELLREYGEIE